MEGLFAPSLVDVRGTSCMAAYLSSPPPINMTLAMGIQGPWSSRGPSSSSPLAGGLGLGVPPMRGMSQPHDSASVGGLPGSRPLMGCLPASSSVGGPNIDRHSLRGRLQAQDHAGLVVCFTSVTRPSTLQTFSQRICPKNLCSNFTCKGKECNSTNCDFACPRKALDLKCKKIIGIANHFTKKDMGWFNEYHFMRMPNITDGVKKLLGNTKGPTSKMACLV